MVVIVFQFFISVLQKCPIPRYPEKKSVFWPKIMFLDVVDGPSAVPQFRLQTGNLIIVEQKGLVGLKRLELRLRDSYIVEVLTVGTTLYKS